MHRLLAIAMCLTGVTVSGIATGSAQAAGDCPVAPAVVAEIRQMLTAPDNGLFFEIWTREEITCACIELYYNDPPTADFHDRVLLGAVVLLGKTGDPRAVPVLIDAVDTHGPQALYALGNYPTVDALNALTENVTNPDPELRENAAEGLRRMPAPAPDRIEEGWTDALRRAIDAVEAWLSHENEPTFRDYFLDAHHNLATLLAQAASAGVH